MHPESCKGLDKHPPFWVLLPQSTFNIMLTCRILYRETQDRRFSVRSWRFKNFGGLEHFNKYASKARRATVREVSGVQLANYRYKAQLSRLPSLQRVHIGPLRTYYSLAAGAGESGYSTESGKRFNNVGWSELMLAVNQGGFDWIPPYGLEPVISEGKWDEFVLSIDFDVDEIGQSRYWVPATLNARTKKVVRFWDEIQASKGGVSWPELRPETPSLCILAQFEDATKDPQAFRDKWKRYMIVE